MSKNFTFGLHSFIFAFIFSLLALGQILLSINDMSHAKLAYIGALGTGFLWSLIYLLVIEKTIKLLNFKIKWLFPLIVTLGVVFLVLDLSSLAVTRTHINTFFISAILQDDFRATSGINDYTFYSAVAASILIPFVVFFVAYYLHKKTMYFKMSVKVFIGVFLIVLISERLVFSYGKYAQTGFIKQIEIAINWRPQSSFTSLFKNINVYVKPQKISESKLPIKYTQLNKPNIVIVMAESLRSDMMHKDVMPNINKHSGTQFRNNFSTSNGTHFGLISFLYGIFPTYYSDIVNNAVPSPLFEMVKQNGYKTHAVSSYHFNWFGMQNVINKDVFDSFVLYEDSKISWDKRDAQVKNYFIENFNKKGGSQFFYLTLHSTHHNYSYPNESKFEKFKPVIPFDKNLFTISRKESEKIINRYKNSAFYVDSLVGEMIEHIKDKGEWNNTIFVFFGDHGEEFFEDGHTLHANTMNIYQNSAALFIHKPDDIHNVINNNLSSHIDFLPTVWDQLSASPKPYWFTDNNLFETETNKVFTTKVQREHPVTYGVVTTKQICRIMKKEFTALSGDQFCSGLVDGSLGDFYKLAKE